MYSCLGPIIEELNGPSSEHLALLNTRFQLTEIVRHECVMVIGRQFCANDSLRLRNGFIYNFGFEAL